MALGETPPAAISAQPNDQFQQISQCVAMIAEAQKLLQNARHAEVVLAQAQRSLAQFVNGQDFSADIADDFQDFEERQISEDRLPCKVVSVGGQGTPALPPDISRSASSALGVAGQPSAGLVSALGPKISRRGSKLLLRRGSSGALSSLSGTQSLFPKAEVTAPPSPAAAPLSPKQEQPAQPYAGSPFIDQVLVTAMVANGMEAHQGDDDMAGDAAAGDGLGTPRLSPVNTRTEDETKKPNASEKPSTKRVPHQKREYCCYDWFVMVGDGCCGLGVPVLVPDARFRISWDVVGLAFIVYLLFAIPYSIAFAQEAEGWTFILVSVIDSYFIADVLLNLITGYRNSSGQLVVDPRKIIYNYSRGWLIPDMIASIPWEWFPNSVNYGQVTKMIRFLRLARLLRILRLGAMSENVRMILEANPGLAFFVGVIRVVLFLLGITHWTACAWYLIGAREPGDMDTNSTWVTKFIPPHSSDGVHYLYSCFFTLTTMTTVGYGDITAQNPGEVAFAIFLLLISAIIFPGLMSAISDLLTNLNLEKHQMTEKMLRLGEYMTWRHVPRVLFVDVRGHLQFLWETNKGYDTYEEEIKQQLPPVLRKELCYHIYGEALRQAPYLSWMSDYSMCLKDLSQLVKTMIESKGDSLFRVGQPNEQIYCCLSGKLRLSLNEYIFDDDKEPQDRIQLDHDQDDDDPAVGYQQRDGDAEEAQRQLELKQAKVLERISLLLRKRKKGHSGKKRAVSSKNILENAYGKLQELDVDQKWAAGFIQRRWRIVMHSRERSRHAGKQVKGHRPQVQTMTMHSPVYFGESCLWQPLKEWETDVAPVYTYNVRCESRVELIYISRLMIKEIVDRYSPWLSERFEVFRSAVLDGLDDMNSAPEWQASQARSVNVDAFGTDLSPSQGAVYATGDASSSQRVDSAAAALFDPHDQLWASIRSRAAELTTRSRQAATRLECIGRNHLSRINSKSVLGPGDELPARPQADVTWDELPAMLPAMPPSEEREYHRLREPLLPDSSNAV